MKPFSDKAFPQSLNIFKKVCFSLSEFLFREIFAKKINLKLELSFFSKIVNIYSYPVLNFLGINRVGRAWGEEDR